jgi:hypothetical protein
LDGSSWLPIRGGGGEVLDLDPAGRRAIHRDPAVAQAEDSAATRCPLDDDDVFAWANPELGQSQPGIVWAGGAKDSQ